ncbi:hypothetical protein [Nostoc sp. UHCC 0252]|uniref:hypothetical protein n=1 Tax=Nostoc sp. UHCC 0252 TaxID=3110241 RepID=UPI002B1F0DA4|nr:hypothetical protein [Nostoc sp. UHCC 0252]MEA5604807.1 hypothetical protein [Nostoc sp. UHCC 0252]
MNKNSIFTQFIYGKFFSNKSGYCLVAYTDKLKNQERELTDIAENIFSFWGTQGIEGNKKAVGISPYKENQLLLFQVAPATNENGQSLSNGNRGFEQHRYILLPKELLIELKTQTFLLLIQLFDKWIPYFSALNVSCFPQASNEQKWWDIVSDILEKASPEEISKVKVEQIQECWNETDIQGQSFLLLGIAALANQQQLLLTLDKNATDPALFSESLLLLLPHACRREVAIAAGTVDEHECNWAKLIIKTNSKPKDPLPQNTIWLNRSTKEFVSENDNEIFKYHQYVNDFIAPIQNKSDIILRFIEHLNKISDDYFPIEYLKNPDSLARLIPGLPEEQQVNLFYKYIPLIQDFEGLIKNIFVPQASNQLKIIWQSLRQLFVNQLNYSDQYTQKMLIVLKQLPEQELNEILENDVKQNEKLADDLYYAGLFIELRNQTKNTVIAEILREISYIIARYKSTKDFQEAYQFSLSCVVQHPDFFWCKNQEFLIFDAALKVEPESELIINIFNDTIAPLLPYVNNFLASNLYKHLAKNFSNLSRELILLYQHKVNGLMHLARIANEMKMGEPQTDKMYVSFLKVWSPNDEAAHPFLVSIIEKSTTQNLKFQPSLLYETYLWFKEANYSLWQELDLLEQHPNIWDSWYRLATKLYKEPQEYINFLERNVGKYFVTEIMITWLKVIDDNLALKNAFLYSYTWLSLESNQLSKLLAANPNSALILAKLIRENGRLELISGDLLHYLCQHWISQKSIDIEWWNVLTSPSVFESLTNNDWLTLFNVNWVLGAELSLRPPKSTLNEQEKHELYNYVIRIIENTKHFEHGHRLLNNCYIYELNTDKLKQIANKVIKLCTRTKQVLTLLEICQSYNLTKLARKEILTHINPENCDKKILFDYLKPDNKENDFEHDFYLLELLFKIPLYNDEEKKEMGLFLKKYITEIGDISLKLLVTEKLINKYLL